MSKNDKIKEIFDQEEREQKEEKRRQDEEKRQQINDCRETAELLHAAHTITRMAFGAVCLCPDIVPSQVEGEELGNKISTLLETYRKAYDYYSSLASKLNKELL